MLSKNIPHFLLYKIGPHQKPPKPPQNSSKAVNCVSNKNNFSNFLKNNFEAKNNWPNNWKKLLLIGGTK